MIAKAKSIAHGGVSLGYITRQGKAQVVKLNHLPEDASPQSIYGYMKLHQKLGEEEFQRRPLKNNMIRTEISPSREESEGWTMEDWKQLAEDFVQAFDRVRLPGEEKRYRSPCRLPNSQYIIALHTDSKSGIPHLHLDCNRVDMDNCLNSDHRIGIRAKTATEEVNRLRGWKRTEDRFEENKARIKKDCLAVLSGMSAFSWEKYTAALEAKGYKVNLKLDASVKVRGYSIQSGNSVYKSSIISRDLTQAKIQETWEKMRQENRYGQMTDKERVNFMLSDEGAECLFGFTIKADWKDFHVSLPGRVIKVLNEEQVQSVRTNPEEKNNGAATRTRTTSSGPAAASARRWRW